MICNTGFYQKIRNDITDRLMGLKDVQNKQKIKYNVSFISFFIPAHPNGPTLGRQEHSILIVLFKTIIKITWKVTVNVICFTVSSTDDLEISLVAVNHVHHDSCRMVCCLWHPQTAVEHFMPCTESHQVTQVVQDRLQQ